MSRRDGRLKRGLFFLAVLGAALVALWFFWLRHCGSGKGPGQQGASPAAADAGAPAAARPGEAPGCRIRVDAQGIHLEGKRSSLEETLAACKRRGRATLTVTGDATFGTVKRLREALRRAQVIVTKR